MADREIRVFEGDVLLRSGHKLRGARLVYATYGTLSPGRDNAVLFPTRFGANHEMNESFIGPDHALDPSRYFIVVPNLFGNGTSTSPSNASHPHSGPRFPGVSIADCVDAQRQLLLAEFGIDRLRLAVGWSMGAQQAYQWASHHPDAVERLCVICGAARTAPHNRVFLESLLAALEADAAFLGGWYETPPRLGLRAMGRIYAGWAYSQDWYRDGLYQRLGFVSLDDWLVGYWDALFERREANDLVSMIRTWIAHDVAGGGDLAPALRRISAKTLLLPCDRDLYFRTADNAAELPHIANASLTEMVSPWGHMSGSGQSVADLRFIDAQLASLLNV